MANYNKKQLSHDEQLLEEMRAESAQLEQEIQEMDSRDHEILDWNMMDDIEECVTCKPRYYGTR